MADKTDKNYLILDFTKSDNDLLRMPPEDFSNAFFHDIGKNNVNQALSRGEMDALDTPVFSSIVEELDDRAMQKVLRELDNKEVAKALKFADDKAQNKIFKNKSKRASAILREDMEYMGPISKDSSYEAQRKIIWIIGRLCYTGEIVMGGSNRHFIKDNKDSFKNIEEFETFLVKRWQLEEPYGTIKDVTMCRFFDSPNSENILEDIKLINETLGMGNFPIPETNIKLINYSVCPRCGRIFSFKDLTDYYANPKIDHGFANRAQQFRNDTRVFCNGCNTYFLPALVIADGTPRNEVQFLCRVQTVNAVEAFYHNNGINVLSTERNNVLKRETEGKTVKAIRNDVFLNDLSSNPTLISNLLQYTPANLVLNLIDGTNYEQSDILFGAWQ